MKSEQSLIVSEGMRDYWRKPGVRERRALQAKVRERKQQLARLERVGMVDSDRDRYRYIASKLDDLNQQLDQLK